MLRNRPVRRLGRAVSLWVVVVIATLFSFSSGTAHAASLFSVDVLSDKLVSIDTQTGAIEEVGSLGVDVTDLNLVLVGGSLLMLDKSTENPVLRTVNPATGAVVSSVAIVTPGINTGVEGFANDNGQLIVSFNDPNSTTISPWVSRALGEISLAGVVSTLGVISTSSEIDSLLVDSTGDWYGLNVATAPGSRFYDINSSGSGFTLTEEQFYSDFSYLTQMTYSSDGGLYGITSGTKELLRFDTGSFSISSQLAYDSNYKLLGLAPIPEPSTALLLGIGLAGLGMRRRTRHAY